jgi:hypothetical protein
MTTDPDRDRSISRWLEAEAPDRAPDELLEASRDRIRTTQQHRPFWLVRRDASMSTLVRLGGLAAAVIVLAVAGTALILGGDIGGPTEAPSPLPTSGVSNPTDPATSPAPSAAALLPGEFTACVPSNAPTRIGTTETEVVPGPDGELTVERTRGFTWSGAIEATDPRFSGAHFYSWDANGYTEGAANPYPAVVEGLATWAEGHRIENAEGAWTGSTLGITLPDGTQEASPALLTGEGAYAGLTAILMVADGDCFFDYRGIVIEVPDSPVPYAGL